jgi:putative tryptophan/tyrosine transport system substrate-binding protein
VKVQLLAILHGKCERADAPPHVSPRHQKVSAGRRPAAHIRNLQLEYRWSGGEANRIQASAKELVSAAVEVIVARSTPAVAALLMETRTIPFVFSYVVDPVGSGFVQSFARPGGNVTGFQVYEFTIAGKWLQLLTEAAPSLRRIGLIHNPATAPQGFLRALETLAPSSPVPLIPTPVHDSAEIDAAIAGIAREPGGGLIIMPDIFNDANHPQIVALAAKHGLPAVYTHRFDDGLICYGPDLPDLFHRVASYVDRILRGEKPSELPVSHRPNMNWLSIRRSQTRSASPCPISYSWPPTR